MMQGTSFEAEVVSITDTVVYVCQGRVLDDGVDGRMTYVGRGITCMWISQTMKIGNF